MRTEIRGADFEENVVNAMRAGACQSVLEQGFSHPLPPRGWSHSEVQNLEFICDPTNDYEADDAANAFRNPREFSRGRGKEPFVSLLRPLGRLVAARLNFNDRRNIGCLDSANDDLAHRVFHKSSASERRM